MPTTTTAPSGSEKLQGGEDSASLRDLLDDFIENTEGDEARLGDLLEAAGPRSYGPLLVIPSLLAAFPLTGGIPGMSILTGSIIFLIAVQMFFSSSSSPWLPQRLLDFSFPREKLKRAIEKTKPYASWLDRWFEPRLTFITRAPWHKVVALICAALALTMYPLALLPFAVAVPAIAVLLFGIGLMTKDGLLVLAGYGFVGLTALLILSFV